MKSQERHKLKTNELAESLSKLPDFLAKHGKNLFTAVLVVVVAGLAGAWWWRLHQTEQSQLGTKMIDVSLENEKSQRNAMMRSIDEKAGEAYNPIREIDLLADVAGKLSPGSQAINALIQQAETLRSQLLFSDQLMTDEQKMDIVRKAESLYQRVLTEYPNDAVGQGAAKIGLGLLAEDQKDWDKARTLYQQIVSEANTRFAGTQFPRQAQARLKLLDSIAEPIEFVMAATDSIPPAGAAQSPDQAEPAAIVTPQPAPPAAVAPAANEPKPNPAASPETK